MINIDLGFYRLETDKDNYIVSVNKPRKVLVNGKLGQRTRPRYFAALSNAVNSLVEREIKQSDATTLEELMVDIARHKDQVTAQLPKNLYGDEDV